MAFAGNIEKMVRKAAGSKQRANKAMAGIYQAPKGAATRATNKVSGPKVR